MRRIVPLIAVAVAGCANIGAPPGGPLRTTPPAIVRVTPDSGATNVRTRGVTFEFDVVVNDRDIAEYFLVSPREGAPRVTWRRSRVEVRPRRDFRPNTAYAVTLLPGLRDLRNNTMRAGRTVVFSTGPTIPPHAIFGRVFDWLNERVAPNALIEVIRRPDSLPYVGAADSTGQFAVGPLDEGTYSVRAILDNNKNRAIDPGEAWDSVSVVVRGTSPFLELLAAPRDTIAPRLLAVTSTDSVTLVASFDRPLHPGTPATLETFRVVAADSTRLRIVAVLTRAQADSAQRAVWGGDSTATDTTARPDTTREGGRRDVIRAIAPPAPPLASQLRPSRPAPPKDLVIRLDPAAPLRSGAMYRVTAFNLRGLLGQTRTSDRVITVSPARRETPPAPTVRPP